MIVLASSSMPQMKSAAAIASTDESVHGLPAVLPEVGIDSRWREDRGDERLSLRLLRREADARGLLAGHAPYFVGLAARRKGKRRSPPDL